MEQIRIRCPKCTWEPDGRPYWQCTCGVNWDSFATGARCPGCGKVWEETQCVRYAGGCEAWSPHLDWYEGLDDIVEKLKEEIREGWRHPATSEPV
jgi:hypothetical protein